MKRYGEVQALDGVDLHVETGTVFGLLGPNGAGKSTLISLMTGVMDVQSGEIAVEGRPAADRAALRRAGALAPQDFAFYPALTGAENLRFFASELIRETVFELYSEEVPYSVAVRVEEFRESGTPVVIRATVLVERPSQKGIVIGKRGAAIRELGTRAREKIEALLDAPVFLELWVKVLPNWRKSALELERLGFPLPEESD